MFTVKWTENGKDESKGFEERQDAFLFQDELLIRRTEGKKKDAKFELEVHGVWG